MSSFTRPSVNRPSTDARIQQFSSAQRAHVNVDLDSIINSNTQSNTPETTISNSLETAAYENAPIPVLRTYSSSNTANTSINTSNNYELFDRDLALAIKESYESNVSVMANRGAIIAKTDDEVELIAKRLHELEMQENIDSAMARSLAEQDNINQEQLQAHVKDLRQLQPSKKKASNKKSSTATYVNNSVEDFNEVEDDILEKIRLLEEREQSQLFESFAKNARQAKARTLREQQDVEYETVLQQDIIRETRNASQLQSGYQNSQKFNNHTYSNSRNSNNSSNARTTTEYEHMYDTLLKDNRNDRNKPLVNIATLTRGLPPRSEYAEIDESNFRPLSAAIYEEIDDDEFLTEPVVKQDIPEYSNTSSSNASNNDVYIDVEEYIKDTATTATTATTAKTAPKTLLEIRAARLAYYDKK